MGGQKMSLPSRVLPKRKNFWDLAYLFPDFAVGMRFIRRIWWNKPETYWTVTRVIPVKNNGKYKSGIAYGVFTSKGEEKGKEQRIRSTTKRDWRFVPKDQKVVHWPMGNRKDLDMNHQNYPQALKEKYYDIVP